MTYMRLDEPPFIRAEGQGMGGFRIGISRPVT